MSFSFDLSFTFCLSTVSEELYKCMHESEWVRALPGIAGWRCPAYTCIRVHSTAYPLILLQGADCPDAIPYLLQLGMYVVALQAWWRVTLQST